MTPSTTFAAINNVILEERFSSDAMAIIILGYAKHLIRIKYATVEI